VKKERKSVAISLLKTPERNTRIHPEKQIKEIRRCLNKWGQYKNAVIDENYLVLAGNGLVEAMRQEGFDSVETVMLCGLSGKEKDKLMLADNKTGALGVDNLNNIELIIRNLDGDFDIPGFDDEVLASINAASEEISKALDEYGKATEENLAEIEAHAGANEGGGEADAVEPAGPDTDAADSAERNSVVCPKCGEVIWL
jgi:hypothetical protein